MGGYFVSDENGNMKEIFDFQTALLHVKDAYEELEDKNRRLQERIAYLEDEKLKDKEIEKYKKEAEDAREALRNGFAIPSSIYKKMTNWQVKHVKEKHCIDGREIGCGAIGGRFTWSFIPTGIGTLATCTCNCGESISEMTD